MLWNHTTNNALHERRITLYCSKCGRKLPNDAVFCDNCGTKLAGKNASNQPYSGKIEEKPSKLPLVASIVSTVMLITAAGIAAFLLLSGKPAQEEITVTNIAPADAANESGSEANNTDGSNESGYDTDNTDEPTVVSAGKDKKKLRKPKIKIRKPKSKPRIKTRKPRKNRNLTPTLSLTAISAASHKMI